jgi:hypothetical protein
MFVLTITAISSIFMMPQLLYIILFTLENWDSHKPIYTMLYWPIIALYIFVIIQIKNKIEIRNRELSKR